MGFFAFAKNIEAVVFICDLYIWNLLVSYTGKDSIPLACHNWYLVKHSYKQTQKHTQKYKHTIYH